VDDAGGDDVMTGLEARSAIDRADGPPFHSAPDPEARAVAVDQVAMVLLGAASVALVFVALAHSGSSTVLAAGSVLGAAALVLLAFRSMEAFVLVVLVARSGLDGLHAVGHTASTDPATALGAVFTVVALLWLASRRLSGRKHPVTAPSVTLLAFLVAAALATLGSEAPGHSLGEVARLATAILMFFVVDRLCEDTRRPDRFVLAVLGAAVVPVAVALAGPLVGVHRTEVKDRIVRAVSTFAQSNPFGHFLTLVLVVLFAYVLVRRDRTRVVALVAAVPVLLVFGLTYTRLAWVGAVIAALVMLWVSGHRRLAPALVVLLVVGAVVTPQVRHRLDQLVRPNAAVSGSESGFGWRIGHWGDVAGLSGHNPVTGIGPDVVALRLSDHEPTHNDYLGVFVELGVVGLVTYAGALASLVALAVRAQRRAAGEHARTIALAFVGAITAYLVASAAANLLGQVVIMWYLLAVAGAAAWVARHGRLPADSTSGVVDAVHVPPGGREPA